MPSLLLASKKGSFSYEGLKYCVHCQKLFGAENALPFGISESGFYAFDAELNYLYKPHGVWGIRANPDREYSRIISPYSSYIAIEADF